MKRVLLTSVTIYLCVVLLPVTAYAQASITGVVKDASGAVLPGVTVEASSPALIEKSRTVVTDGSGQYRIVDLRPGLYDVTFALSGFAGVKREGIELKGTFVATVNAELRVGAVQETVTVSGQAPIVDVQNTTQQRVMNNDVIDRIPVSRYFGTLAALIPGVTVSQAPAAANGQDVGGAGGDLQANYSIHGSRGADQHVLINGTDIEVGLPGLAPNVVGMEEVQIDTAAVDTTLGQGGVRVNFIPKDGGNQFHGQ